MVGRGTTRPRRRRGPAHLAAKLRHRGRLLGRAGGHRPAEPQVGRAGAVAQFRRGAGWGADRRRRACFSWSCVRSTASQSDSTVRTADLLGRAGRVLTTIPGGRAWARSCPGCGWEPPADAGDIGATGTDIPIGSHVSILQIEKGVARVVPSGRGAVWISRSTTSRRDGRAAHLPVSPRPGDETEWERHAEAVRRSSCQRGCFPRRS